MREGGEGWGGEERKEASKEGIGEFILFFFFFFFFLRGVKRRVYVISVAKLYIFSRVTNSGQVPTHALKGGGWRQMRL